MNNEYWLRSIYEVVTKNNKDMLNIWLAHIVFTWRWWLGVILSILPWVIWIKIKDRKQIVRLLFVGLIVGLVSDILDIIGLCYGLWYYEWKVIPITPIYIPWNLSLFPVIIMVLLQFKPELHKFIKAICFAFFSAFVSEPIFSWLGIYIMLHWKHWYSFIIYVPLYLLYNKIYNSMLLRQCVNS